MGTAKKKFRSWLSIIIEIVLWLKQVLELKKISLMFFFILLFFFYKMVILLFAVVNVFLLMDLQNEKVIVLVLHAKWKRYNKNDDSTALYG